ncbi:hypothetical protein FAGKG844_640026 [Frankia sp. AgKG'84/4]
MWSKHLPQFWMPPGSATSKRAEWRTSQWSMYIDHSGVLSAPRTRRSAACTLEHRWNPCPETYQPVSAHPEELNRQQTFRAQQLTLPVQDVRTCRGHA